MAAASSVKRARRRAHSKVRDKKVVSDANTLAHALTMNKTTENIDLDATVAGYTHRGGFKVAISNIEHLTDTLVQHWKCKCSEMGYDSKVSYNASLSIAVLHARSRGGAAGSVGASEPTKKPASIFGRVHPLTIAAAALFVFNAGRHYFLQDM